MVHGDLKGVSHHPRTHRPSINPDQQNILVDDSGTARIGDFGFTTLTKNLDSVRISSRQHGHTVRWAAPEVMDKGPQSWEADMFSFAMVMVEVGCIFELHHVQVSILFLHTDAGVYRRSPICWCFVSHGNVGDNTRQAASTASAPNLHGEPVEFDATLLGSRAFFAPRGPRSLASYSQSVSPLCIPRIIHLLIPNAFLCLFTARTQLGNG
jgi:hypothetical protein